MSWACTNRAARYCIPLAVVALFFAASIGISHAGMSMDENGHMHDCPFMGMTAICQMNPLEHIAAWQSRFATLTVKESLTMMLLALLALAIPALWQRLRVPIVQRTNALRFRESAAPITSNYLADALSNGILHPKVF